MPDNNELVKTLRTVMQEELKPINERLDRVEQGQQEARQGLQQVNTRLDKLEKGQKNLQKDVTTIKKEVRAVWDDILRLDKRLTVQEKKTAP